MFDQILFLASAVLTLVGAMAVCFCKNLIHACLYLLGTFMGVAGLYATLGADFLAATQLVVYAGGVVILILFAVMLTGGGERKSFNRFGLGKIPAMGNLRTRLISLASVGVISLVLVKFFLNLVKYVPEGELPPYESTVEKIGILLVSDHVLIFEVSSLLLLGVLVGAALIARPRRS